MPYRLTVTQAVLLLGLCLLVAGVAQAATTVGSLEPTGGTWRAYRGTGFITLVCSANSEAAALACAAADAERRVATTRYQIRYPNRYVSVTYSAPPPTADTWTLCAVEGQRCAFTGTRTVRYGSGTTWVQGSYTDGVLCANTVFGDPLRGVGKQCELSSGTPLVEPPPPATGAASLTWTPPTQNTDGSALTNLAGYRIAYGLSPTAMAQTVQVANSASTAYSVTGLASGTWYFAIMAYTSSGAQSAPSNTATKIVR